MQTHSLSPHHAQPPIAVRSVDFAILSLDAHWLRLRWRIEGASHLVVPPFAGKRRADNLWQHTCFELFVRPAGSPAYSEFNLSPSERWAAYDFTSTREGMSHRHLPRAPDCTIRGQGDLRLFDAAIPRAGLPPLPWACAVSAVIEEDGGALSYWALAHPGAKPDFHDPACFVLTVAAPQAA